MAEKIFSYAAVAMISYLFMPLFYILFPSLFVLGHSNTVFDEYLVVLSAAIVLNTLRLWKGSKKT